MTRTLLRGCLVGLVMLTIYTSAHALPATVTHIYELDGSYADDLGGPALGPAGGTLKRHEL